MKIEDIVMVIKSCECTGIRECKGEGAHILFKKKTERRIAHGG